ncbi:uncharacterized protein LOC101901756 [Musca domestica]|uniref:Uncharacterized protein LOC101901756 n=1 Tax=Musca domestica TaxID=7370 RepID=A0A1I8NIK8_MUSDO|nr:uncharacterized protein LOC101901756 [Musca domestica]
MFTNSLKSVIKWRYLSQCCSRLGNISQTYASFSAKDLLYETSDEAGTLLTRFAKHVAIERHNICEIVPNKVRYADFFPVSDMKYFHKELSKTSADQLASIIVYASTYRSNADPSKFAQVLNELDRYAVDKLCDMNVDTILRTMYAFLFLIPNWMTRLDFYSEGMKKLYDTLLQDGCKFKELFVQVSFYFGLSKKISRNNLQKQWNSFLHLHLESFLDELSTLDVALVASAAYKTSTKIENEKFNQRLVKEVLGTSTVKSGNDALLITLIKSLRFQRVNSDEVCEHVAKICMNSQQINQFQTRGQIHIFALFADNLWDNEECMQILVQEFIAKLRKNNTDNYVNRIRGKDITTFLWCCFQLKCRMTPHELQTVEDVLLRMVYNNEFKYFPDQLVEACLSLWSLGLKSKELLQNAIKIKSDSSPKRQQPKVDSRLTVLLSAAQIEEPTWCMPLTKGFKSFNIESSVPAYLLNPDIPYNTLLSRLREENSVASAAIVCPINGINIPGVLVQLSSLSHDSYVFVEIMTKSQTLQFSNQPVGILRLKVQLLQAMGYSVKLLSLKDLEGPLNVDEVLQIDNIENITETSKNSIKA